MMISKRLQKVLIECQANLSQVWQDLEILRLIRGNTNANKY